MNKRLLLVGLQYFFMHDYEKLEVFLYTFSILNKAMVQFKWYFSHVLSDFFSKSSSLFPFTYKVFWFCLTLFICNVYILVFNWCKSIVYSIIFLFYPIHTESLDNIIMLCSSYFLIISLINGKKNTMLVF